MSEAGTPWDDDQLPPYVAPGRTGPRAGLIIGLAVGVVAAVAGAGFALVSFTGGDGASDPEAAVEALFDALADEDLLGVLEALAPGERRALREPVQQIASELQRLGILAEDLDLSNISGFRVEVDGLELASATLADDLAEVRVLAGTIEAEVRPDELPIGPVLQRLIDQLADDGLPPDPETTTSDLGDDDIVLVALRQEGGWHVSLGYSIAEAARRDSGYDRPAYGQGIRPEGADSPEGAVIAIAQAAADVDVRRVMALLAPGEMRALHDYAPLFLPEIEEEIERERAAGLQVVLEDIEVQVIEQRGDVARVAVTRVRVSGENADGPFRILWDGECIEFTSGTEDDRICAHELEEEMGIDIGVDPREMLELSGRFTVVREGGQWYLSPARSGLDTIVDVLGLFDRQTVEGFADAAGGFLGMFMGMGMTHSETFVELGTELGEFETIGPPGFHCFDLWEELHERNASGGPPDEDEFARVEAEVEACLEAAHAEAGTEAGAGAGAGE